MTTPTVSSLRGTGMKQISMPTLDPSQRALFDMLMGGTQGGLGGAGGGLSRLSQLAQGGDESFWKQMEAPAMRQFGEMQGNMASRFSGMGTGARKSSGFQNTMGSYSSQLAESLQSNRQQMQQDAISQLLGLGSQLLGTPLSESYLMPKKKKGWESFLSSILPGLSQGIGSFGAMALGKKMGF